MIIKEKRFVSVECTQYRLKMQDVRACACARIRIYSTIPRFPRRLLICIPAHLHICTSVSAKRANSPRPSAHRQISTFAHQRAQPGMSAARERKIARFFLHAATRWHSARYVRFMRNSRKFLQNFFAKNLVCVPKVRTFALANQK